MEDRSGEKVVVAGLWVSEMEMLQDSPKVSSRDHQISEAGRGQVLGYLSGLTGVQLESVGGVR